VPASLPKSAGEEGYLEHIDHVMAAGTVYIDPTDEFSGNTPLMNAAVNGHLACVQKYLERNAQVCSLIEARWLVNGGHGASLRRHNQLCCFHKERGAPGICT
jgi:ankyrin repeat protein